MSPVERVSRVLVGVDLEEASASALKMAGVLVTWWSKKVRRVHPSGAVRPLT
jgi:hypothetical protein